METIEQKKRRLYGKQYLSAYLLELNKILLIKVDTANLLSIVKTDEIRSYFNLKKLKNSYKILFNEKDKLKEIVLRNNESISGQYYVFTSLSINCGVVKIDSLFDFNFNFPFNALASGVITITKSDLSKEILLDFSEENGIKYLEIEVYETKPLNN
jgi:hypothetical protein